VTGPDFRAPLSVAYGPGNPALPVCTQQAGSGQAGDLSLRILLADEVMQAALRSAGLTATTFRRDFHATARAWRLSAVASSPPADVLYT
jgi:hypothetical protein